MIVICGPPWDSCLASEQEMKHQGDRVAVWESFWPIWLVTEAVWDSPGVAQEQQWVFWLNKFTSSKYRRAFSLCLSCINLGRDIVILTQSHAVALGNELSKFTVIGIYIKIDDMRARKTKPDFWDPLTQNYFSTVSQSIPSVACLHCRNEDLQWKCHFQRANLVCTWQLG